MISKANHWARAGHGETKHKEKSGEWEREETENCSFIADFLEESGEGTYFFLSLSGNLPSFHDVLTEACGGPSYTEARFYSSLQSSIKIKWPRENECSGMNIAGT